MFQCKTGPDSVMLGRASFDDDSSCGRDSCGTSSDALALEAVPFLLCVLQLTPELHQLALPGCNLAIIRLCTHGGSES